jgi:hypothetical protein
MINIPKGASMAKSSWKQGKYNPKNPEKYKGTLQIVYRSSWEQRVFYFIDIHPNILEWASESIIIPYLYQIDNKMHRYYIDVNFIINDKHGDQKRYIIEVKPYDQTIPPKPPKNKNSKAMMRYNTAMLTFQKNQDKWMAARAWAKKNGYIFDIWTEFTLGLK